MFDEELKIKDKNRNKKCGLSYTDETNNSANFNFKQNKFNTSNYYFLRGGLFIPTSKAHTIYPKIESEIIDLFKNFDSNTKHKFEVQKEVKFKSLVNSAQTFDEITNVPSVKEIIHWIYNKNYLIHYGIIDNIYYGIADILDPFFTNLGYPKELADIFKSSVTEIISKHKEEFIKILRQYNAPNVTEQQLISFYNDLRLFIKKYSTGVNDQILNFIFKIPINYNGAKLDLFNNKPETLIETYFEDYLIWVYSFPNSYCIIDKQNRIEEHFKELKIPNQLVKFADSKIDQGIQLADYIVNILRSYIDYLNQSNVQDILNMNYNRSIREFASILKSSRNYSGLLVNSVITQELLKKLLLFEDRFAL